VKEHMNDPDSGSAILKDITSHFDATHGKTLIELSADDTDIDAGVYYYDITVKDADDQVKKIAFGRIKFCEPVTQRT
jgi:hypothetical protein